MEDLQVRGGPRCSRVRPAAVDWEHHLYKFAQFLGVLYEPLVSSAFETFLTRFSCLFVQLEKSERNKRRGGQGKRQKLLNVNIKISLFI